MPRTFRSRSLALFTLVALVCPGAVHAFDNPASLKGVKGALGDIPSLFFSREPLRFHAQPERRAKVVMTLQGHELRDASGASLVSCAPYGSEPCPLQEALVRLPNNASPEAAGIPYFAMKQVDHDTWYLARIAGHEGWIASSPRLEAHPIDGWLVGAMATPDGLFTSATPELFDNPGGKRVSLAAWRSKLSRGLELLVRIDAIVEAKGVRYAKLSFWQARPEILAGELTPRRPVRLNRAPAAYVPVYDSGDKLSLWYERAE